MGKLENREGNWLSWWVLLSVARLGIETRDLYCQFHSNRWRPLFHRWHPHIPPQSYTKTTSAEQNQAFTRYEITNQGHSCNFQFQSIGTCCSLYFSYHPIFPPAPVNVEHHLFPQILSTISLPDSISAAWACPIPECYSPFRLAIIWKSK